MTNWHKVNGITPRPNDLAWRAVGVSLVLSAIVVLIYGAGPWSIPARSAHADGGAPNLAYVAGAGPRSDGVAILDISQRRAVARVSVGGSPAGVVLSADARYLFVAQSAGNHVAVVDAHAQRVVGTIQVGSGPTALAIDFPFGGSTTLYVANTGSDTLTIIDADARRVLATVPVGLRPSAVAIAGPNSGIENTSDPEIYVASAGSNTVAVVSEVRRRVVDTIAVPGGPTDVTVPATGGVAYVATESGNIDAISVADHRFLGVVLHRPGDKLGHMDYDAVTGQIYVPDAAAGTVEVLRPVSVDTASGGTSVAMPPEPARTLRFGGGPAAVAITFDGAYGFVARGAAGSVTMLDMGSRGTLATINVGGTPHAIISGAYPPPVSAQVAFGLNLAVAILVLIGVVSVVLTGRRRRARTSASVSRVVGLPESRGRPNTAPPGSGTSAGKDDGRTQ
jgi:YVTN family beta-propeller protein